MKYIWGLLIGMCLGALVVASKTRRRAYTIISRNEYTGGF